MDKMSFGLFRKNKSAEENFLQGVEWEKKGCFEQAFEQYQIASEAGNPEAMWAISSLYLFKNFRTVKRNNMLELLTQGIPAFPWNLVEKEEIDYKSAFEWSQKAADCGHGKAAYVTGALLCEGTGCEADVQKGLSYLQIAMNQGIDEAKNTYYLFRPVESSQMSDKQYTDMLKDFSMALLNGDKESFRLYSELKGGTSAQLAKLGYALMAIKNMKRPNCDVFPYITAPNGIPYLPVAPKRANWKTFIRLDTNAFSKNALILFSTDICVTPDSLHMVKIVGEAEYRSPAFGWLEEEKKAYVLQFDSSNRLDKKELAGIVSDFRLIDEEYKPDNVAFFIENGEKEYSVEISAIKDGILDILYRYTIGGSNEVHEWFEPDLIKLSIYK